MCLNGTFHNANFNKYLYKMDNLDYNNWQSILYICLWVFSLKDYCLAQEDTGSLCQSNG